MVILKTYRVVMKTVYCVSFDWKYIEEKFTEEESSAVSVVDRIIFLSVLFLVYYFFRGIAWT